MTFGLKHGCGLVINHLVSMEYVVPVVHDDVSIEREFIAHMGLPVRVELNGSACGLLGFALRNRE
jgi:hypothetical protein